MRLDAARLRLVAITQRALVKGPLEDAARAVLAGGATAIMLREKDLAPRALYELARRLRAVTRDAGALLIVNRSVEVALAAEADAVQLGGDALDAATVRRVAGARLIVGCSAHRGDDLASMARAGADYVTYAPVFAPISKPGVDEPLGLDGLAAAARHAPLPVVALGGITPATAGACLVAGAVGVAAIGGLMADDDPRAAAAAFVRALAQHRSGS